MKKTQMVSHKLLGKYETLWARHYTLQVAYDRLSSRVGNYGFDAKMVKNNLKLAKNLLLNLDKGVYEGIREEKAIDGVIDLIDAGMIIVGEYEMGAW